MQDQHALWKKVNSRLGGRLVEGRSKVEGMRLDASMDLVGCLRRQYISVK
jgi:hypothetical protein